MKQAKTIWLSKKIYPEHQRCRTTVFAPWEGQDFCVAEFEKRVNISYPVTKAFLEIFADTKFRVWVNGCFIGTGPAAPGGDYGSTAPMETGYVSCFPAALAQGENVIFVQVQLSPQVMTESSRGQGGLTVLMTAEDGEGRSTVIGTDSSWMARINTTFTRPGERDDTRPQKDWTQAEEVKNTWKLKKCPLPPLLEEFKKPVTVVTAAEFQNRLASEQDTITISPGCPLTFWMHFDRIYAGYPQFDYQGTRGLCVYLKIQEITGHTLRQEKLVLAERGSYRGLRMHSIGVLEVTVSNFSDRPLTLSKVGMNAACYPPGETGSFCCSDPALNAVYELGRHTLTICRQSLHLDSPTHQETLGCTGDYFVESMIGYCTFADHRLTRLDLVRTADWLRLHKGVMFHTSYSLIWVQMLREYLRYTGDESILDETMDVLHLLLALFHTYTDQRGCIVNPPNYMFVDWRQVDEFQLHHPPKALGQAALNAFYYKALTDGAELCEIRGEKAPYRERAKILKRAFHNIFYDPQRELYFDGEGTPLPGNRWMPDNVCRRYFSQHTNSLAVLYGLCEDKKRIMTAVIEDKSLIQAQPYFMFFVLEALFQAGLFPVYGLDQMRRWTVLVQECGKGLKEVWNGFDCDYSHAWGAAPTYYLPMKLLGLSVEEDGFRAVRIKPDLMGLEYARIKIPTPFGFITAQLSADGSHQITVPPQIRVVG